jgi:hypothetical protein
VRVRLIAVSAAGVMSMDLSCRRTEVGLLPPRISGR